MASKSFIFLVCFVASATLMMGAAQVEAHLLPGLPRLPNAIPCIGNLFNVVNIRGLVFCSANGTLGTNGNGTLSTNGTSIPIFPNATVQLRCGNRAVATGLTNINGVFSILADLNNLGLTWTSLINGCNIVVTTPLVRCNANLPSTGALVSTGLRQVTTFLGTVLLTVQGIISGLIGGVFRVITLVPTSFIFDANFVITAA